MLPLTSSVWAISHLLVKWLHISSLLYVQGHNCLSLSIFLLSHMPARHASICARKDEHGSICSNATKNDPKLEIMQVPTTVE